MINWSVHTYESLASTQDTLKELIDNGEAKEGTLVRAIEQTGGYGRHGRKWESGSGNLSFSFFLCPKANRLQNTNLSLIAGIALMRAIQRDDAVLKWPNDIMLSGKKCAGILLENIPRQGVVVGIGVNITSSPIGESSYIGNFTPEGLLDDFLKIFEDVYLIWQEQGFAVFRGEFMKLSYEKDTPVCVKLPDNVIEGLFQEVDEQGNMLILCKDTQKLQKITSGDVFPV